MAITNDTGDAFIREVDEEYRREKLATFWSRHGRQLLIGLGVLLVLVAAYLFWRQNQAAAADARGAAFATALNELRAGQKEQGLKALQALETAPEPGYRALAKMERAGALAASGDRGGAVALYDAVAADGTLGQPFRDLATLKSVRLNFDALTPAQVSARLRPLALPGSPWFGVAGELSALAYLKAGQPDLARPLLDSLTRDPGVPISVRLRAQQLAAAIGAPTPAAALNTPARPIGALAQ